MRRGFEIIAVLGGCFLVLAGMVWYAGPEATFGALAKAGWPAFAAMGGLLALFLAAQAAVLGELNRPVGVKAPFSVLLQATTVGMAANIVTPSSYLGGEPVKLGIIARSSGAPLHRIAGTIVLAKYLEALSFALFIALSAGLVGLDYGAAVFRDGPLLAGGMAAAAMLGLFFGAGILWMSLARGWRPLTRLARVGLGCFPRRRFLRRLYRKARRTEFQVLRVFREEKGAVRRAFAAHLAGHAAIFLKPAVFFWLGLGIPLGPGALGLIFLGGQLLLAFQLTPSGIGTLDAGFWLLVAVAGLPITQPEAAAFLLFMRFWDAVVVSLGAVLGARLGVKVFSALRRGAGPASLREEAFGGTGGDRRG